MRHIWSREDIKPGVEVVLHPSMSAFVIAVDVLTGNRLAHQFSPGDEADRRSALASLWGAESETHIGDIGNRRVILIPKSDARSFIGPFTPLRLAQWLTGMNARMVV